MDAEIRFVGDLQKLALKPSDVLVLKMNGIISEEQAARLREFVASILPDQKMIILDGGTELGVLERVEV